MLNVDEFGGPDTSNSTPNNFVKKINKIVDDFFAVQGADGDITELFVEAYTAEENIPHPHCISTLEGIKDDYCKRNSLRTRRVRHRTEQNN